MDTTTRNDGSIEQTSPESSLAPQRPAPLLSRRDILRHTLRGGVGLTALALLPQSGYAAAGARPRTRLERLMPGAREWKAGGSPGMASVFASASTSPLSLPMWSDGAKWDQPEYYETIYAGHRHSNRTVQSSDINGDGQDELIARDRGGILCQRFEPDTGQWFNMSSATPGPDWSDAAGWNFEGYYSTIQCADIDKDGRAELLGRGKFGVDTWKYTDTGWKQLQTLPSMTDALFWNLEEYYATIQCADIDGDGQAELLGRSRTGIVAYKYQNNAWVALPELPYFTDALRWNRKEYYSTIQCADINGDGRAEILGRGANGIEVYAFNNGAWSVSSPLNAFADTTGWNKPEYYSTIQCADIDGDGYAEVLGRGVNGIEVYQFKNGNWQALSALAAFSDMLGWSSEPYYATIQCADIDGDGQAEILGRGVNNVEVYKFNSGAWSALSFLAIFQDAQNWNRVQYYKTIQTARVHGSVNNPNNPPNPHDTTENPDRPIAVLLGRSFSSVETWRHVGEGLYGRTSAPLPEFTGEALTMYNYLTDQLFSGNPLGGIRYHYNQTGAQVLNEKAAELYVGTPRFNDSPLPTPSLPAPSEVSDAVWRAVTWQIYWELRFAADVNDWYGTKVKALISDIHDGYKDTLDSVAQYIDLPATDGTPLALDILSLIFSGIGALASIPDGALAKGISVLSGLIATAFTGAADFAPGSGSIQATYAELVEKLLDQFDSAIHTNGLNQQAITGGLLAGGGYQAADWGLLSAIGQQIESTLWNWPDNFEGEQLPVMQHDYAINAWQIMIPSKWYWTWSDYGVVPANYPDQYYYKAGVTMDNWHWIGTGSRAGWDYPNTESLDKLFQPGVADSVFPLGASVPDVYWGRKGWPNIRVDDDGVRTPEPPAGGRPEPKSLGVDLRIWDMTLSRDSTTGEVVATFAIGNHGLTDASNLWITGAQLRNSQALGSTPSRHIHLAHGQEREMRVRFPANVGVAGSTVVLRLSGQYLNGTFGGSYRVKLP